MGNVEYCNTGSMWVYRVNGGPEIGPFVTKDVAEQHYLDAKKATKAEAKANKLENPQ
jgi:hypothetical protein